MTTSGKLEGLIIVPTGGWEIEFDDSGGYGGPYTATIPAGEYYLTTPGDGTRSLLDEVEFQLNAEGDGTYTVTVADSESVSGTGQVTITATVDPTTVTWTNTDIRDLLGFTGNITITSNTETGPNHARSLWLAYPAASQSLYGGDDKGWHESDRRVVESPTGALYGFAANKKRVNSLAWEGVRRRKARIAGESVINESFERFWLDQIIAEAPWSRADASVCWYPDAGDDATSFGYNVSQGNETSEFQAMRANFVGLWRLELPRLVSTT